MRNGSTPSSRHGHLPYTPVTRGTEKIPFPILSDFNRKVARTYGVLHDNLKGLEGVAKRSVFVIGTDGRIRYDWVTDDPSVQIEFDAVRKATVGAEGLENSRGFQP